MDNNPEPLAQETSRKLPSYHLCSLCPVVHLSVQDRMCPLSEVGTIRHSDQGDQRLER